MAECSFGARSQVKLGAYPPIKTGVLSSLMRTFQRDSLVSRSWDRYSWFAELARSLFSLEKIYIYFRDWETNYNYTFSKVHTLKKKWGRNLFPYFQKRKLNFLFLICICSYFWVTYYFVLSICTPYYSLPIFIDFEKVWFQVISSTNLLTILKIVLRI